MENMKLVVVCFYFMAACFALENANTELEPQLKVQKREKQYLIEDDLHEGHEQKRDERQSTLDPKGNSRIINIRLQPKIITAPNTLPLRHGVLQRPINGRFNTTPHKIPTNIPVILNTAKVLPSPAHAMRSNSLETKINETISNLDKENPVSPNTIAPPTLSKNNIPLESNSTLNSDGNDKNNTLNKGNNSFKAQDPSNTDRRASSEVVQKPVNFFLDEPETLPRPTKRHHITENIEVTPNKPKEIPIVKKMNKKPKKDEPGKKDHESNDESKDADIVQISNGTHLISIKTIRNRDNLKNDRLVSRIGEEDNAPTEERIVNQEPPNTKPIADEPEKCYLGIRNEDKHVGLPGPVFKDSTRKGEEDQKDFITITNRNYEEFEEKSPNSATCTVTTQQTNLPATCNEGSPEPTWNYLQNPYYNPYYHNLYNQYRINYGLAQTTQNMYGQEMNDPRNFGVQINNPYYYGQTNTDLSSSEVILPNYPHGCPLTDTDSTLYPYDPYQPEIGNTFCPVNPEIRMENMSDRIWKTWRDIEIKIRKAQINTDKPFNLDIRRFMVDKNEGTIDDNVSNNVASPYATSSLPINLNGALIYPYYMNPSYRHLR